MIIDYVISDKFIYTVARILTSPFWVACAVIYFTKAIVDRASTIS